MCWSDVLETKHKIRDSFLCLFGETRCHSRSMHLCFKKLWILFMYKVVGNETVWISIMLKATWKLNYKADSNPHMPSKHIKKVKKIGQLSGYISTISGCSTLPILNSHVMTKFRNTELYHYHNMIVWSNSGFLKKNIYSDSWCYNASWFILRHLTIGNNVCCNQQSMSNTW